MFVQDMWSAEMNHRLFGLPGKMHISCVRLTETAFWKNAEIAFWKNSECSNANRLKNGGDTNVNKGSLLIPIPSLTGPNLKGKCHPSPAG